MNWTEFFAMGGYALYVWGSYALALLVFALNVWLPLHQQKTVKRNLRDFYQIKRESR